MSASFQDFLAARLPFPGLAAWSARAADRAQSSRCFANWLTPPKVEQALTRLALAAEGLQSQRIDPIQLCWVFQHVRVYLGLRGDGGCLALFVENRPDLAPGQAEGLLAEYVRLTEQ